MVWWGLEPHPSNLLHAPIMKFILHLSLLALTSLLLLTGIDAAPTTLTARQSQAATPWSDPYNPEPVKFTARRAGQCSLQFSFQRGRSDTGYSYRYEAVYPDGSRQTIEPKYDERLSYSRQYVTPDGYRVDVSRFENACQNGSVEPSALIAYADSGGSRETVYRYNTQPIPVLNTALPALPSNVRGAIQGRNTVVTWNAVSGVESYYILAGYSISSEAGPLPYVRSGEVPAGTTSWTLSNRKANKVIVVAKDSQGVITSIDAVNDVRLA